MNARTLCMSVGLCSFDIARAVGAQVAPLAQIEATSASLAGESCSPASNVPDAGEDITATLCLRNVGSVDTASLVATLLASGNVTGPNGPQNYGRVAAGGSPVCRDFTYRVNPALNCGADAIMSLDLQDGGIALGTVVYAFPTAYQLRVVFTENFDGVVPPSLPAGWSATTSSDPGGVSTPWATVATASVSLPNHVVTDAPAGVSDERLDSPSVSVVSPFAQLEFRGNFGFEQGEDGGCWRSPSVAVRSRTFLPPAAAS